MMRALAILTALTLLGASLLALGLSLLALGSSLAELLEPSRDLQVVLAADPRTDIPIGLGLGALALVTGALGVWVLRRASSSTSRRERRASRAAEMDTPTSDRGPRAAPRPR